MNNTVPISKVHEYVKHALELASDNERCGKLLSAGIKILGYSPNEREAHLISAVEALANDAETFGATLALLTSLLCRAGVLSADTLADMTGSTPEAILSSGMKVELPETAPTVF